MEVIIDGVTYLPKEKEGTERVIMWESRVYCALCGGKWAKLNGMSPLRIEDSPTYHVHVCRACYDLSN